MRRAALISGAWFLQASSGLNDDTPGTKEKEILLFEGTNRGHKPIALHPRPVNEGRGLYDTLGKF